MRPFALTAGQKGLARAREVFDSQRNATLAEALWSLAEAKVTLNATVLLRVAAKVGDDGPTPPDRRPRMSLTA